MARVRREVDRCRTTALLQTGPRGCAAGLAGARVRFLEPPSDLVVDLTGISNLEVVHPDVPRWMGYLYVMAPNSASGLDASRLTAAQAHASSS